MQRAWSRIDDVYTQYHPIFLSKRAKQKSWKGKSQTRLNKYLDYQKSIHAHKERDSSKVSQFFTTTRR